MLTEPTQPTQPPKPQVGTPGGAPDKTQRNPTQTQNRRSARSVRFPRVLSDGGAAVLSRASPGCVSSVSYVNPQRGQAMTQPPEDHRAAISHQRVVHASARVLAYRRWNRDDKGSSVFRQLALWITGAEETDNSEGMRL